MTRAGHLPTKHFDLQDWQSMRVWLGSAEDWAGDGFFCGKLGGKPVVGFNAPVDSGKVSFAVRPIVRVPMGKQT
jgi:hypothetical protein